MKMPAKMKAQIKPRSKMYIIAVRNAANIMPNNRFGNIIASFN